MHLQLTTIIRNPVQRKLRINTSTLPVSTSHCSKRTNKQSKRVRHSTVVECVNMCQRVNISFQDLYECCVNLIFVHNPILMY